MIVFALAVALLSANDGSTPLHWASYNDDSAKAAALINEGADVNATTDLGVTPLWAACQNGSIAMVRALLDAGANPNIALLKGETPLMVAARSGYAEIVELLLARGANPNARGPRSQTALMWAASQRHANVVKVLLQHNADVHLRSDSFSQVMGVPPHGHPEYNRLIPAGADTALLFATRNGDVESASLLIAAGANVNDKDAWGVSAVMFAAHSDFRNLVELLLHHKADPNGSAPGFTALHAAIMHRDEPMVAALLKAGANPNQPVTNWTPTRRSSRDYHFAPSLIGASPFWLAARFATPGILRLLAQHGADPKFVHHSNYLTNSFEKRSEALTALMAALGMGAGAAWTQQREAPSLEAVQLIVELGADVNAKNTDGRTALAAAKAQKLNSIVQYLTAKSEH